MSSVLRKLQLSNRSELTVGPRIDGLCDVAATTTTIAINGIEKGLPKNPSVSP